MPNLNLIGTIPYCIIKRASPLEGQRLADCFIFECNKKFCISKADDVIRVMKKYSSFDELQTETWNWYSWLLFDRFFMTQNTQRYDTE